MKKENFEEQKVFQMMRGLLLRGLFIHFSLLLTPILEIFHMIALLNYHGMNSTK